MNLYLITDRFEDNLIYSLIQHGYTVSYINKKKKISWSTIKDATARLTAAGYTSSGIGHHTGVVVDFDDEPQPKRQYLVLRDTITTMKGYKECAIAALYVDVKKKWQTKSLSKCIAQFLKLPVSLVEGVTIGKTQEIKSKVKQEVKPSDAYSYRPKEKKKIDDSEIKYYINQCGLSEALDASVVPTSVYIKLKDYAVATAEESEPALFVKLLKNYIESGRVPKDLEKYSRL